ncbi:MAG TPA: hypothetical protein VMX18_00235 [Candidatus Bipolaricaulota bacterium]|nr:hypothetical protein [Candidatus Bipolaricaulota bacterium]
MSFETPTPQPLRPKGPQDVQVMRPLGYVDKPTVPRNFVEKNSLGAKVGDFIRLSHLEKTPEWEISSIDPDTGDAKVRRVGENSTEQKTVNIEDPELYKAKLFKEPIKEKPQDAPNIATTDREVRIFDNPLQAMKTQVNEPINPAPKKSWFKRLWSRKNK